MSIQRSGEDNFEAHIKVVLGSTGWKVKSGGAQTCHMDLRTQPT